jgi:hypothetical protein
MQMSYDASHTAPVAGIGHIENRQYTEVAEISSSELQEVERVVSWTMMRDGRLIGHRIQLEMLEP